MAKGNIEAFFAAKSEVFIEGKDLKDGTWQKKLKLGGLGSSWMTKLCLINVGWWRLPKVGILFDYKGIKSPCCLVSLVLVQLYLILFDRAIEGFAKKTLCLLFFYAEP